MNAAADPGGCPKEMTFGPCGGVRADRTCEVDARPCPFVAPHPRAAPDPAEGHRRSLDFPQPAIIVDVRAPNAWLGDHELLWGATAEALQGCVALLGEHVDNPRLEDDSGGLPAGRVISILRGGGVDVIATVTGRDRDLDDAAETMRAYRDAGATAIHCVTGDHPAALGIERSAHFGAESMTLIGVAHTVGLPATVAESPSSPGRRPGRLAMKQRSGAAMCLLNHAGDHDDLIAFADACRDEGTDIPLIAAVPMVADKRAARALAAFPGLRLPHGMLSGIVDAADPEQAGLDACATFVEHCATSQRFAGINLSGAAGGHDPWSRLRATTLFIERARAVLSRTYD